jgi:hypothetical protein
VIPYWADIGEWVTQRLVFTDITKPFDIILMLRFCHKPTLAQTASLLGGRSSRGGLVVIETCTSHPRDPGWLLDFGEALALAKASTSNGNADYNIDTGMAWSLVLERSAVTEDGRPLMQVVLYWAPIIADASSLSNPEV